MSTQPLDLACAPLPAEGGLTLVASPASPLRWGHLERLARRVLLAVVRLARELAAGWGQVEPLPMGALFAPHAAAWSPPPRAARQPGDPVAGTATTPPPPAGGGSR